MSRRAYKFCFCAGLVLVAIAAALDGLTETLLHHYPAFSARFPGADPYWWNPALSWQNKGAGFLNRTVLVVFSDAYHLLRFSSRILLCAAIFTFGYLSPKFTSRVFLRLYIPLAAVVALLWMLVFELVFSLLF